MTDPNLVSYYSRRAPEYERIYHKPERQEDLRTLEALFVRMLADRDLLELGCGTGYWTERLAPWTRSILAMDASEEMLELARRKRYPEGRVRFQAGNAYRAEALPGAFSAVFAGFFWSHVPRQELASFLARLHARLGPGGRVVFTDNRFVEGSNAPIAARDAHGNTYQDRRLADGSVHRVLKNFPDEGELKVAVAAAAATLRLTELTYYWCLAYDLR